MNLVKCGVTRDGLREQVIPPTVQRECSISCKALKKAISSLHRVDDFDCEYIGSGFFSDIYKVVHKVTRQVMVLKKNIKSTNRSNVRREIQLMNILSHPNILRFFGVCVIEGHMHALVEYVNGGSLEQLLADKSIDLPWTLRIHMACDIAKGIKYLHSKGYMHRDLTSKNILIKRFSDGKTVAVVADLGLADKIPEPDKLVASVGSPYWMAPECISSKKYNEKADVFSYGIVLCEIIARVEADPDVLPRTKKFGVDYVEFSKMSKDCPLHLLHQAFICCQIEPSKRPSFEKIVLNLQDMKSSAQMAVILADLSRLGVVNSGKNVLNRMLLEKILDEKLKQRKRSADDGQHSINQTPPPSSTTLRHLQATTPNNNPLNSEVPEHSNRSHPIHFVPVTPMIVGKVMSKDDVYYAPQEGNPFPVRLRSAKCVNLSKSSLKSSPCTTDDDTDRGILDDCTEFLELHSPQERLLRSQFYQQSMPHSRHHPITCFPRSVMPDFISTPSSTSSFSRFNGRLQRSNSMPGSPASVFENEGCKDSTNYTTSNSISSGQLKNNFGEFSSANTSFSIGSSEKLSGYQNSKHFCDGIDLTSDVSEYGSSSMDSALGSEMTRGRPKRSCVMVSRKPEPIQRQHRVGSATVYRSSSTVYPHHEEAALLAHYFEICRRDSLNSSQNSSSPYCSMGNDDSDNKDLASNSFYSHPSSPKVFSSKDSNLLLTSSSGVDSDVPWDDQDSNSEFCFGKRDDPKRRSKERFLELVKSWENNSSNQNADQQSNQEDETASRAARDSRRKGGQAKLMEFAEFYLLRRFQELKQKWERRQQQSHASSKSPKSVERHDGDDTIRNSPEKSFETDPAT